MPAEPREATPQPGAREELTQFDIAAARALVNDLCKRGDRAWRMCIPPQPDDSDMLLTRVIDAAETMHSDLIAAAGELLVPLPEPGTDMARLLSANVLLRQRNATLARELAAAQAEVARLLVNVRETSAACQARARERDDEADQVVRLSGADFEARYAMATVLGLLDEDNLPPGWGTMVARVNELRTTLRSAPKLRAEVARLRALVEAAWREGYEGGWGDHDLNSTRAGHHWKRSKSCAALAPAPEVGRG